jgi:hypothetical protein
MPIFDPTNIQTSITRVLQQAGAPADHTKAFILTGEVGEHGGVQAAYVQRFSHGWAIDGEFELTMDREVTLRAGLIWSDK